MAEIDLTGLLGIETPQTRSKRLLEEGAALSAAVQSGSPAAVAAANLPAATASMRGNVGRLFGIDTRTPAEKLQAELAGTDLSSAAGLSKAAELARNMGMDAQAVALATQAGVTRQEEQDRSLRRKREEQIIDLAAKEDERADTVEERQQRAEARAAATLAINQAAVLRDISESEAQRTAAQDAFVKEFPEDVELAQAIGAGALTLNEARLWQEKGDPADWPKFLKWAEENPDKGYDEFLQFEADLQKTTPTTQGTTLDKAEREDLNAYIDKQLSTGRLDRGAIDLPEGVDIEVIKNKVQKLMELDKTIDMETGLAAVLREYGIGQEALPESIDPALEESLSNVSEVGESLETASTPSSPKSSDTSIKPSRGTVAAMNRGPRKPTITNSLFTPPAGGRGGRGFPYRN